MVRVACLILAGMLAALPAWAQSPAAPGWCIQLRTRDRGATPAWEARIGAAVANPGGRESGLLNFNGELVTPRAFALSDRISAALVPRFHLGASVNFNGTRYAYAGATWTVDLTKAVFVEASLGAAINDGKTGGVVPENRLNVGCGTGSREAAALGLRLNDRWSLVATLEHFSPLGCSDRDKSRGPANFGAKLGYTF
jgi:lipid A 3-O-deacylase